MTTDVADWPPAPGEVRVGRSGTKYRAVDNGMLAPIGADDPDAVRPADDVWDDDRPLLIPGSRAALAWAALLRREADQLVAAFSDGDRAAQMRDHADMLDPR